jgi:hypothetical protein
MHTLRHQQTNNNNEINPERFKLHLSKSFSGVRYVQGLTDHNCEKKKKWKKKPSPIGNAEPAKLQY